MKVYKSERERARKKEKEERKGEKKNEWTIKNYPS